MQPRLLVLSSLFPSRVQPSAGLFIRERMFRVGRVRPIVVVAPQPWFPGQSLIRRFRPHFRPMAPVRESMDGIEVHRPRFFSVPGLFKRFDGVLMALGSAWTVRRLRARTASECHRCALRLSGRLRGALARALVPAADGADVARQGSAAGQRRTSARRWLPQCARRTG